VSAGGVKGSRRRVHGERRGRLAGAGEAPLPDAGPVDDPFVRGLDERFEKCIRNDSARQRGTDGADLGVTLHQLGSPACFRVTAFLGVGSSHTSGWPGRTGSPSLTRMPATRASIGARTSTDDE